MAEDQRGHPDNAEPIEVGELGRAIAALRGTQPPADVTERVKAGLGPLLGPSSSGGPSGEHRPGPAGPTAPGAGPAAALSGGMVKTLLVALAAVAVGVGSWTAWRHEHSTVGPKAAGSTLAASAVPPPAPPAGADSAAVAASDSVASPAVSDSAAPVDSAAASSPAPAARPTEAQLLASARRLLQSDPAASVRLLQEHARLYPEGMLSQEREVLLIEARARLGQMNEARDGARDFLKEHPNTAYGNKIRETAFGDASTGDNSDR